ncbi:glycosyltransferase involved in cell wall biosynthesis [Pseudomonas sp. TE3786]
MRVLVLTASGRLPDLSSMYRYLERHLQLEVRLLSNPQQRCLKRTLADVLWTQFDRVLLDLPFRAIRQQSGFLAGVKGLVIYEEDAYQNYLPGARHSGQFLRFYRRLAQARVVVTGAMLAERLRADGVAASFLAKGFDPAQLFVEATPRDIELAFIGRTASATYARRKALLQALADCEPLQVIRTEPGDAYRQMLNRIQVFVSADIGLDEYMAKSFEAMACGCVVLAWRQAREEAAIGLEEGKHLLLYSSLDELRDHLAHLRHKPELVQRLSESGRVFVQQHLSYEHLAAKLSQVLQEPALPDATPARWRLWWSRLSGA